ncbi:aminopeptidase P family N-terminal domain-containing protein [Chelativorans xinjiangense]|uniref:aminopeptidase P family N-terminal domain-containing protein n=1 Tax=Chelativorans xinjiangense TaxID=2681485 RepID=UPI00135CE681|nr:aminopeptidase P family N-terminal domain-containing protein [Chelativorans xinjiangense]
MRHGLMLWREGELSQADVLARQRRLQAAMRENGLDAVLVYTNHVRSAGVTYLTGFTPYWSDALLFVPREGQAIFATALSKRVGNWIRSTNPTVEIAHSPQPGRMAGERLSALSAGNIGVVELDRMPSGLVEEITSKTDARLIDATDIFAAVRALPNAAELALATTADRIAANAFAEIPADRRLVGDVTEVLELNARLAGAEECYVAAAPDLAADQRLARMKGNAPLGGYFAIRLSVAYNGVWIRRTESLARMAADGAVAEAARAADRLAEAIDPSAQPAPQIAGHALSAGMTILDWTVEAPVATRPLQPVASRSRPAMRDVPYGVLTLTIGTAHTPLVFTRSFGLARQTARGGGVA